MRYWHERFEQIVGPVLRARALRDNCTVEESRERLRTWIEKERGCDINEVLNEDAYRDLVGLLHNYSLVRN